MKTELLEKFSFLVWFRFVDAYSSTAVCKDDNSITDVLIFRFINETNVMVEILFIDNECRIGGFYAVDDDLKPITKLNDVQPVTDETDDKVSSDESVEDENV